MSGESVQEPADPAVPAPDPTGDERVDSALARLGDLGAAAVAEHVEIFEDVHRRLQDVLASVDQESAAPPIPAPPGPGLPPPRPVQHP